MLENWGQFHKWDCEHDHFSIPLDWPLASPFLWLLLWLCVPSKFWNSFGSEIVGWCALRIGVVGCGLWLVCCKLASRLCEINDKSIWIHYPDSPHHSWLLCALIVWAVLRMLKILACSLEWSWRWKHHSCHGNNPWRIVNMWNKLNCCYHTRNLVWKNFIRWPWYDFMVVLDWLIEWYILYNFGFQLIYSSIRSSLVNFSKMATIFFSWGLSLLLFRNGIFDRQPEVALLAS